MKLFSRGTNVFSTTDTNISTSTSSLSKSAKERSSFNNSPDLTLLLFDSSLKRFTSQLLPLTRSLRAANADFVLAFCQQATRMSSMPLPLLEFAFSTLIPRVEWQAARRQGYAFTRRKKMLVAK